VIVIFLSKGYARRGKSQRVPAVLKTTKLHCKKMMIVSTRNFDVIIYAKRSAKRYFFLLYKIAQNPKKITSIYEGAITRIYSLLMDV